MIFLIFSIYYISYLIGKENKEKRDFVEDMDLVFDQISKTAIFSMPFRMTVIDENGRLKWYNSRFKRLIDSDENLVGKSVGDLVPDLDVTKLLNTSKAIDFQIDGRHFHVFNSITKTPRETLILSYAVDNTEDQLIREAYENEQTVIMKVVIDNYDEVKSQTPENQMLYLSAEIDRQITEYFSSYGGYTKKYENDRYLVVLENKGLKEIKKNNFKILDNIMELELGNKLPVTLSIGVGSWGDSPFAKNEEADTALDMALGRGAEQAVVKEDQNLEFFGGRTQSTTKRNTVRSRVFAHALSGLIDDSDYVFVMGHSNPDMDSFGACLGIYEMARKKGVKCRIMLKEVNDAIRKLYDLASSEIESLREDIIVCNEAELSSKSLVVVVDNNRYGSVECRELLEKTDKIVVIDHHRKGEDNIQGATLSYIDPNASSTSRMITEMIQYMFENVDIQRVIAEALLAGITVDTKNFNFQTTSSTFEAASFLKRQGANSMRVKELFKDNFDTFKYKSEVVSNAEMYDNNIAISVFDKKVENASLIASQAADELLDVSEVEASFVICLNKGKTHISARSLGNISVQIIMEKLGGGGHLTASATQMDLSPKLAYEQLIKAINEYKEEEKEDENNIN